MPYPNRSYHKRGEPVAGMPARSHPLYATWHNMLRRCYLESGKEFCNYGGRGISVDERWWHFANFVVDMGAKPSRLHTLERVNNDAGYSKSNCIWASRAEQCLNRRKFKNNTTGHTGVLRLSNGSYLARFDFEGVRYLVGRYAQIEDAVEARTNFVELFKRDRVAAERISRAETISLNSSSGVRGVTPHEYGGYIVRVTVGGVRKYLGYFKTLQEATDAKRRANQVGD